MKTNSRTTSDDSSSLANIDYFDRKLHALGDKLERIAQKLRQRGVSEGEELGRLGEEVEHFCDDMKIARPSEKSD